MQRDRLRPLRLAACTAFIATGLIPWVAVAGSTGNAASLNRLVEVVDVDNEINAGMAHRVSSAVDAAHTNGASALLVRIDTDGGSVDDAIDISQALTGAGIPTIAFITGRAWSAGALIAMSCDKIVMEPGASLGAALPITIGPNGENPVDQKMIAAFRSKMEGLAQAHHRDTQIAAGFVDPEIVIPGLKKKGQILSLNPQQARAHGYADAIESTQDDALAFAGFASSRLVVSQPTWGEQIAEFVAQPAVSGLLLTIGFLGILVEMQTMHLIAGIIGVAALGLFFGAHVVAGTSNWVITALFGLGVLGLLFEFHVLPGHGISGLTGSALILASIVLAFGSGVWILGLWTTVISLILSIVIFMILLRWLPESELGRRFAFAGTQLPSEGFVAAHALTGLVGLEGVAESMLRPAGVVVVDGKRYQVQTEGDFVPPQSKVVVQRVEGATIVVKRL
ncbi:MAG TPA: NfeD family protein [Candidatus Eremiobacteraceae bacterium]|nr:NfeD family protein [Candidatus Eremiobacteraceae bacterium]